MLELTRREREEARQELVVVKERLTMKEKEIGELLAAGHLSSREAVRMMGSADKTAVRDGGSQSH